LSDNGTAKVGVNRECRCSECRTARELAELRDRNANQAALIDRLAAERDAEKGRADALNAECWQRLEQCNALTAERNAERDAKRATAEHRDQLIESVRGLRSEAHRARQEAGECRRHAEAVERVKDVVVEERNRLRSELEVLKAELGRPSVRLDRNQVTVTEPGQDFAVVYTAAGVRLLLKENRALQAELGRVSQDLARYADEYHGLAAKVCAAREALSESDD
jgi:chromosome segregation ATPase